MIKGKRGAVELSITTIVVVVIGVTLLALGLAWVSGIFERLQSTTSGAFEKADAEIGDIFTGGSEKEPFRISPTTITVKQGERSKATIIISNPFGADYSGIKISRDKSDSTASGGPQPTLVKCLIGDTLQKDSNTYDLKSGREAKLTVFVEALKSAPIGAYSCNFGVNSDFGGNLPDKNIELDVRVIK